MTTTELDPRQAIVDTHAPHAGVDALPADHGVDDAHSCIVGGHSLHPDHEHSDAQRCTAGVDPSADDQQVSATHDPSVVGSTSQPAPSDASVPKGAPGLADALLLIYADALDDLERVRIATENRARSLAQVKGLTGSPEELRLLGMVDAIGALEHAATLDLKRALRKHPLGPWVKRTVGIGEKQGGRLLAAIGDPYWNSAAESPRTVSQLWAYCGYHVLPAGQAASDAHDRAASGDLSSDTSHDPGVSQTTTAGVAPSRARGQKANWNATAKMRAFLCAEACIKQSHSPYRKVYDDGREKYADAVHPEDCKRCGPAGKPALAGSPLSAGHQHARAMRLVAKAILRDLWIEARDLREAA